MKNEINAVYREREDGDYDLVAVFVQGQYELLGLGSNVGGAAEEHQYHLHAVTDDTFVIARFDDIAQVVDVLTAGSPAIER